MSTALWLPRSTCGPHCLPRPASLPRISAVRAAGRVVAIVTVVLASVLALPAWAMVAPAHRWRLNRGLARAALAALGVRHAAAGRLPRHGALLVANHVSWLDALVILAHTPARLVAKHEVRRWPVVGVLAAAAGTVFLDRSRPRRLPDAVAQVRDALREGAVVAAFAEGTTWCGRAGGPFRPALFQAAVDAAAPVAPVTLRFRLADGSTTTVAAFLGEDTLLASLIRVVTTRGIGVLLRAHPPLHPEPGACRRTLARAADSAVGSTDPTW